MSLAALQTIHRAISGVSNAPDGSATYPMPSQVNAVDLPIVLLFPASVDITAAARDEVDATQTYDGIVLVTSQRTGIGVDTSTNAIWDMLDAFKARYKTLIGTPELLSDNTVVTSYHDDGQRRITYRGGDWLGFQFRIEVWEPV